MVQQLAQLAADSLPILRDLAVEADSVADLDTLTMDSLPTHQDEGLIDDGIFEIIPYDISKFSDLNDRNNISFRPFYDEIKSKLQSDALLPAENGTCCSKIQAFWASDTELLKLFNDGQLAQLTGTTNAHWVFRSRGKKDVLNNKNNALSDYIDGGDARQSSYREPNLIISSLDPESMLRKITAEFISAQPIEWLHMLYSYLNERQSYQKYVKFKPIFIDQSGHAVPAFDDNEQPILFLPDDTIDGYTTVHKELLSNEASLKFIESFGIKKPSLRDEIYNKILPAYADDSALDTTSHFFTFFRYFRECDNEKVEEYIKLIQDKAFLRYTTAADSTVCLGKAANIYMPTSDLKQWFETKPDTQFLLSDEYRQMVSEADHKMLDQFLQRLGVASSPSVMARQISPSEIIGQTLTRQGRDHVYAEFFLDGCDEVIESIDEAKSILLWRMLATVDGLFSFSGLHTWSYHGQRREKFHSSHYFRLLKEPWILTKSGELVPRNYVTFQSLSEKYDTDSVCAKQLIDFLEIRDETKNISHLSEEEIRKITLANEIEQSGLSEDEIREAIAVAKRKKISPTHLDKNGKNSNPTESDSPVIRDIEKRRHTARESVTTNKPGNVRLDESNDDEDTDDYTPKAVDFGKKLDRATDRYASELNRLDREQKLYDKANKLPRYSYGWFLAMLELECMTSSESNTDSKTISITFRKVETGEQSSRTIVFKEPSRFIPQSIEEFSGVRVDLEFGNGQIGKLHVESFTAKEFTLLGKLESESELSGIDLNAVVEARIQIQNPSFLLYELLERFRDLNYDQEFDMKAHLPANIDFVFGPPGTGKTTHLSEKVIIPAMINEADQRLLVLAPTNKAADVLTLRIIDKMGGDTSYLNWLIRFGSSADDGIQRAGVWRDRSFNIGALKRSVTVTTVARFAYDGFSGENGKKLHDIDWDAIVIDEASMISLASIIYPLYRLKPEKFVIAGDPFQIEPIVSIEQLKDENIYTLVGLSKPGSFAKPATEPHDYMVTNLDVQYRSLPAIGEVFSRFTYDGILKHYRTGTSHRTLTLTGLPNHPLNLIKFPVSKYESIYRAKRMETGTPYQTYSALFAFEFVRWIATQVEGNHLSKFRIGVIAPYRAQASLLSKLNDSWVNKPDAVEIQVGTIHGFQGDECDAIIAIFNPPPTISRNPRMFLNKQNILNVAISRAKDYLFIVMPDNKTEGIENLYKIARIEELFDICGACEYDSGDIEQIIWGNPNYIEQNTFSTGHQLVNVYRKPERYYEVRSDDSAIDVQIHEAVE